MSSSGRRGVGNNMLPRWREKSFAGSSASRTRDRSTTTLLADAPLRHNLFLRSLLPTGAALMDPSGSHRHDAAASSGVEMAKWGRKDASCLLPSVQRAEWILRLLLLQALASNNFGGIHHRLSRTGTSTGTEMNWKIPTHYHGLSALGLPPTSPSGPLTLKSSCPAVKHHGCCSARPSPVGSNRNEFPSPFSPPLSVYMNCVPWSSLLGGML